MATAGDGSADAAIALTLGPLSTPTPVSMVLRDDKHLLYVADSSIPVIHVIDVTNPSAPKEIAPLLATSLATPTRQVNLGGLALSPVTRDYKRYLYAIDQPGGSIMIFDVTDEAASPHVPLRRPHPELDPFAPVDRLSFSAPVATMAFVTHDWPLLVPNQPNVPMGNMPLPNSSSQTIAYQGLLCNPNPAAHPSANTFNDLGAYYRVDQAGVIQPNATVQNFPTRLRGVFAFATLTNGSVVTIDVDDWDAPCRRPDPMIDGAITGLARRAAGRRRHGARRVAVRPVPDAASLPGPAVGLASPGSAAVTLESSSSRSRRRHLHPRSSFLIRNDPTLGPAHPERGPCSPRSSTTSTGPPWRPRGRPAWPSRSSWRRCSSQASSIRRRRRTPDRARTPRVARRAGRCGHLSQSADVSAPPARAFSPSRSKTRRCTQNQGFWTVSYEGVLPASTGIFANIASTEPNLAASDSFFTLTFATAGADLCGLGIEDWGIGQAKAQAALQQMAAEKPPLPISKAEATLPQWTSDYVEITDDILPQGDQYWAQSGSNACWDIPGLDLQGGPEKATDRFNRCQATFGTPGSNPDLNVTRDAPILEAYKDHLVVGRFGFASQFEHTANRTIDPGSPNSPTFTKLMTCCFHEQAAFKVRAGGEWIAAGQEGVGLLNHVQAQPSADPAQKNRCVLSCDPQDALLNARSFDVPWGTFSTTKVNCAEPSQPPSLDRNDPLAMRNPMFSYVTWGGCGTPMLADDHTLSARDLTWKFSVAGGFTPLTIAISGATGTSVSPQSMLFIDTLGQLAVVDGSQQGLVLIDLNSVAFTANYF